MAKQKPKVISGGVLFAASAVLIFAGIKPASAVSDTEDVTFQVNVKESLSVTITKPTEDASGNIGDFLRNDYSIEVNSNNAAGFTASMYADTNTYLVSGTNQLQTLDGAYTRGSFPTDSWGYSLGVYKKNNTTQSTYADGQDYGETSAGNNDSYYRPLTSSTTTPITIISAGSGITSASQDIYFGAKGGYSTPAGTYEGTVVVSVVSGVIDSNTNPITPTNPDQPTTDPTANDNTAVYTGSTGAGATQGVGSSGTTGTTVGRVSSTDSVAGTTTTTTQISGGDNTAAYADPQGEQFGTVSDVKNSTFPATALLATAAVTASTGILLFALAKRDDDDDDDEDDETPLTQ